MNVSTVNRSVDIIEMEDCSVECGFEDIHNMHNVEDCLVECGHSWHWDCLVDCGHL